MNLSETTPANPAGGHSPLTSEIEQRQTITMTGWCGDGYLLPGGESVSIAGNTDFTLSSTKEREAYRAAGSQDEWLDRIPIYAQNYSRLYLMLGAAFGAPLLSWAGLNGAIIHLYGGNHDVQNAVQRIGQSVWGHGQKNVQKQVQAAKKQQRATPNLSCGCKHYCKEMSRATKPNFI